MTDGQENPQGERGRSAADWWLRSCCRAHRRWGDGLRLLGKQVHKNLFRAPHKSQEDRGNPSGVARAPSVGDAVPMHRRLVVPLLALCLASLAGCSSSGAGIAMLDRPATSKDALPPDAAVAGFQPGTTRLAARTGGFSFYLARPPLAGGTGTLPPGWGACLIVAEPEVLTCGATPLETRVFGVSAQLVPDDFDASTLTSTGWEQVQRNLFVKGLDHSSRTPPRHPDPEDEG